MEDRSRFLAALQERLQAKGLRTTRDVTLPNGVMADLVASRTYFSWKGLVLLSQHVVVRCADSGTQADLEALFDAGFSHAKKVNRIPLLRGMQFGYMVIPCLVLHHADESVARYAESLPRKHWSLFEFPVVVDLNGDAVHYYRKTALWGAAFFSDMRRVVENTISPVLGAA